MGKPAKMGTRKVVIADTPLVTVWYDGNGKKHKSVDNSRTNAAWRRGEYEVKS